MRADDQVTGRDLSKRGLMRTIITRQHKLSRYFAPGQHHVSSGIDELLARNDLELFDLDADPGERRNLAATPDDAALALIEHLNTALNDLIAAEIGDDDGDWLPRFPGAPWASAT
jgi:arylsulfatase